MRAMALPEPVLRIPPLNQGDHLTREEFERRWELHPEIKKAELINGMVFIEMTVSRWHGKPHASLNTWLGVYASTRPEIEILDNATVRLGRDDVQPDVLVRRIDGGTSTVAEDNCIFGPPELVVEVAASSTSYDLFTKKDLYRRAGVSEYLVWQVYERRIAWWSLRDGAYQSIAQDHDGLLHSLALPGLRLSPESMINGDMAAVLAALS